MDIVTRKRRLYKTGIGLTTGFIGSRTVTTDYLNSTTTSSVGSTLDLSSFLSWLHSRYPSAATWLSVYRLGPDPIGNTALALFSGQPFPSNALFLSCLSSRYQVTSTQAYMSQYIDIQGL
jgi:hypothetical protein